MITLVNTQTKERTSITAQELLSLMADCNVRRLMQRVAVKRSSEHTEIIYSISPAKPGPVFRPAVAQTAWGR